MIQQYPDKKFNLFLAIISISFYVIIMKSLLQSFMIFFLTLVLTTVTFNTSGNQESSQSIQQKKEVLSPLNKKLVDDIQFNNRYVNNGIIVLKDSNKK